MRRLSATALEGVRRAVDESEPLRLRAAEAAPTEEDVGGRAPWLYLHRPDGWEGELASLEADEAARSADAAEAADERSARRRLRAVEDELDRARADLDGARRAVADAARREADVAEERRRRAEVEAERDTLRRRVSAVERERDAAHRRASAADKALADALRRGDDPPPPAVDVDVDVVRTAVESAQAALRRAVDALEVATSELEVLDSDPSSRPHDARRGGGVRLPAALPPGVLADDPAAADHLVRLPAAVLLVDGYNLSLRRWEGVPLPEQRARLVAALQGLSARTGVDVEVVFDGEDGGGRELRSSGGGRRGAVRVTFSPGAVEADDVLLLLVDRVPMSRPVVVATDDRRVQREAAARGANVIGSSPLFVVLGVRR